MFSIIIIVNVKISAVAVWTEEAPHWRVDLFAIYKMPHLVLSEWSNNFAHKTAVA